MPTLYNAAGLSGVPPYLFDVGRLLNGISCAVLWICSYLDSLQVHALVFALGCIDNIVFGFSILGGELFCCPDAVVSEEQRDVILEPNPLSGFQFL